MPTIEVASFKASKAFASDTSVALDQALNVLKATDGCLSVYQGSLLDDKMRKHVIVVWDSDVTKDKLAGSFTLEIELKKLGISSADDLLTILFAIDADPTAHFGASLPELWYGHIKEGYGAADVQVFIKTFLEKLELEDNEFCGLTTDDFPAWLLGLSDEGRLAVFIVGWDSNEERKAFLALEGFKKHLKNSDELMHFERKFLSVVRV